MRVLMLAALLSIVLVGCAQKEVVEVEKKMEVKSVFENMSEIPKKYTCDGSDVSPPLRIENIPENAKSLVIICEDPDAPLGVFTHWILFNAPPENEIPEGIPHGRIIEEPFHAVQLRNDFGKYGYNGPCPPSGKHRYFFKVYALDVKIDEGVETKKELLEKMKGHVIAEGVLVGVYGRD